MRTAAEQAVRDALTQMYQAAEPSKLGNVESIFARYNGAPRGLQTLHERLSKKYASDARASTDPALGP